MENGSGASNPFLFKFPGDQTSTSSTGQYPQTAGSALGQTQADLANVLPSDDTPLNVAEQETLIQEAAHPVKTIGFEASQNEAGSGSPSVGGQINENGSPSAQTVALSGGVQGQIIGFNAVDSADFLGNSVLATPTDQALTPSFAAGATMTGSATDPIVQTITIQATSGNLKINLELDANAAAAPSSYLTGWETAATDLSAAIYNPITLNIEVGYGEVPNFSDTLSAGEAAAAPNYDVTDTYQQVRNFLLENATSSEVSTAVNDLPNTTSLNGETDLSVASAEAKVWGQVSSTNSAVDDDAGFGSNISSSLIVGVALHEFTHGMGRVPGISVMSLFDYTSPGVHNFNNSEPGPASYFSIDGGNNKLADFGHSSDISDFLNAYSADGDPSSPLTPEDPFDQFYDSNTIQSLTSVDLTMMDMLGFDVTAVSRPTLSVTLSGTAQVGQTLTAVPVESGTNAPISYQWQEFNGTSWNNISGATGSTYQLQAGDANDLIRVVASIVANGQTIYALSSNDGPVTGTPTLSVTLSGTVEAGQTLTAVPVESGTNASVSYQWQNFNGTSWNNISGATGSTYQLQASDVNDLIRVVASIVANGQTIYAIGGNDGPVLPGLSVTLSGTAEVDQTLTAVPVESGTNASISYQWQNFNGTSWNNIGGATASTYQLQGSDANDLIRVVASIVADGQPIYALSSNDGPVTGPGLNVTLSGTAQVDQMLTAVSVESGTNAPISYQWQEFNGASWNNISGATGSTYQLQQSDVNDLIRVVASIVADGQTIYAIGGNDGPVAGPSLSVTLSGTAQVGQTLTAVPVESGTNASISYQWQEFNSTSWNNISGATGSTYQLQQSDANDLIRVVASIVADGQTIYAIGGNDGPVTQGGNLVNNGNFATGNFSDWALVTTPNGSLGPTGSGLPAVTAFNVTGSGAQNAATFEVGELTNDGTQQGGGIEQTITTSGGTITFSADIAAVSGSSNNGEAGVFSLVIDGVVESTIDFGSIAPNSVDRGSLSFSTTETAGQHTFGIQITRPYLTANVTPEEFITNVTVEQQSGAASPTVSSARTSAVLQQSQATAFNTAPMAASGDIGLRGPTILGNGVLPTGQYSIF